MCSGALRSPISFLMLVGLLTGSPAFMRKSRGELDDFYDRVIGEHLDRTTPQEQEDIVDLLLRIEREQSEFGHEVQFTRDCTIRLILLLLFLFF